jgi:hypothetical protein
MSTLKNLSENIKLQNTARMASTRIVNVSERYKWILMQICRFTEPIYALSGFRNHSSVIRATLET